MYLYLSLKRIIPVIILTGFLMGSGLLNHDTEPPEMPLLLSSVSQRVDAEADREQVSVQRQSVSRTELLEKEERTFLHVGDGIHVDRRGRAVLRFGDAVTVEVMRNGELELQALHVEPESLVLQMRQRLGIFFTSLFSNEKNNTRVVVETDFAIITATGTQFLVVRESTTALEWVIVLEANKDVLVTSKATGVTVPVSAGWARWIAPTGDPSPPIAYDQQAVEQWLEGWRAGVPEPEIEIGEILLPDASMTPTITAPKVTMTATATATISPTVTPTSTRFPPDPKLSRQLHQALSKFIDLPTLTPTVTLTRHPQEEEESPANTPIPIFTPTPQEPPPPINTPIISGTNAILP